jgi:hypothetical protein
MVLRKQKARKGWPVITFKGMPPATSFLDLSRHSKIVPPAGDQAFNI